MSYPDLEQAKQHIEAGHLQSSLSILRQIEPKINHKNEVKIIIDNNTQKFNK